MDNGIDDEGDGATDDDDDNGFGATDWWLQRDKDGGGGDGHRFCGDTHNNQTDHGEGGW